jgi:nitroreductase
MTDAFNRLVQDRISVRSYLDRPVPKSEIDKCLEAARLAPSACNSQPWKFVVVDEKPFKDELCDKAFSGIYGMNSFAKTAPVIIACVSEKAAFFARIGGYFRGTHYYLIDIGMACEHLALQAAELGLGTCHIGWFDEKAAKRLLGIPRERKVDLLISLGYFEGTSKEKNRKPLDEVRSYGKYD